MRVRQRIDLLLLVLFVSLGLWAFWLEPASLRLQEYVVQPPLWPSECDGLRVAVLADLHVGSPYNGLERLAAVMDLTRAARADIVLLAGDYVIQDVLGGTFVPPEATARQLTAAPGSAPLFAVLGNHDWWLDGNRVRSAFELEGIAVLEDAATEVSIGTCRFWLAGVSDFWEGRHDVDASLRDVPADAPVIALTHNPDVFSRVPTRVSLTVAGHTHGGQVYIPFIGRPIVPSDYGERYAIGHIDEGGRHLFVSSGIGTSVIPVRFLVPPEVSLLILSATAR